MIPVPLPPGHSELSRLELNPAALNVQDLLLQAASQNAAIQLGTCHDASKTQQRSKLSAWTVVVSLTKYVFSGVDHQLQSQIAKPPAV